MQKTRKLSKWLVLPLLVMFVATLLVCSLPTNAHAENGYTHLDIYTNGVLDNGSYTVVAVGVLPVGFEAGHWNIPMGVPVTVIAKDGVARNWSLNGGVWESTPVAGNATAVTFVKDIFSGTHVVQQRLRQLRQRQQRFRQFRQRQQRFRQLRQRSARQRQQRLRQLRQR